MKPTLHVVHPYTYKLLDGQYYFPSLVNHEGRAAAAYITHALREDWRVVRHAAFDNETRIMDPQALRLGLLHILLDPRVVEVATTISGDPFSMCREEIERIAHTSSRAVFIGGVLECCVARTAMAYAQGFSETHSSYSPSLCVSQSKPEAARARVFFDKYGICEENTHREIQLSLPLK